MEMGKPKVFKEEIRKTFILYAVTPILIFSILSYNFLMLYGQGLMKKQNIETNIYISDLIEEEINKYNDIVDHISKSYKIGRYIQDTGDQSIKKQADIYELVYNFNNQQKIKSIFYITDTKGTPIISNNFYDYPYNNYEIFLAGIFKQMKQNPDEIIGMINRVQLENNIRSIYSMGKAITYDNEVVGYVIFDLLEQDWDQIIYSNNVNIVAIMDRHKNCIITTNQLILDSMGKFRAKIYKNKYTYIGNMEKYYIYETPILDGKIIISTLTSTGFISRFYIVGLIFLFILFFMLSIVIINISKKIAINKTKSMDELLDAIKEVQKGNLNFEVNITSNDEFELMGNYFNDMISRIKDLISKNNELINRNRMSEIMQLEAQFNPHFLFNALETLKYMIKIDSQKAVQMVVGLASLLRYSINYEDESTDIKKDIKYIEDYLMIQKYRFNKRLEYIIDIEENTRSCRVPKLIIQPIIENAINHGYAKKDTLKIELNTFIEGEKLILEIRDNGDGFSKERLKEIVDLLNEENVETNHIGLYNVHRRIQLLYGNKYGLHIESAAGEGTRVTIYLPIIRSEVND